MKINKLEIKRKLFHLVFGFIIILLLYFNILNLFIMILMLSCITLLSFLSMHFNVPIFHIFLKHFDREKDILKFPARGALFFMLGSTLSILFFEKDIALAAIIILSVGDSVSSLVGINYGRTRGFFNSGKFLEGTVASIFCSFLVTLFFVNIFEAFLASFFAMVFESLELKIWKLQIDDNFSIPLIAGLVIVAIRLI